MIPKAAISAPPPRSAICPAACTGSPPRSPVSPSRPISPREVMSCPGGARAGGCPPRPGVEPDRALVAVQREEQRGAGALVSSLIERRRPANVVAHARVLDLQDLRAEARKEQRADPAGHQLEEVEHADALE